MAATFFQGQQWANAHAQRSVAREYIANATVCFCPFSFHLLAELKPHLKMITSWRSLLKVQDVTSVIRSSHASTVITCRRSSLEEQRPTGRSCPLTSFGLIQTCTAWRKSSLPKNPEFDERQIRKNCLRFLVAYEAPSYHYNHAYFSAYVLLVYRLLLVGLRFA